MPCANFHKRFVDPILGGSKVHTVRAGKRVHKVGQILSMQTGFRYHPQPFAQHVIIRVRPITITDVTVMVWREDLSGCIVPHLDKFANADGFKDWADLKEFFLRMHGEKSAHGFWFFNVQGRLVQWAPAEWD